MPDYKKMYLTLFRATEQAINTLIEAQRACEELYVSEPETELRVVPLPLGRNVCFLSLIVFRICIFCTPFPCYDRFHNITQSIAPLFSGKHDTQLSCSYFIWSDTRKGYYDWKPCIPIVM